MKKLTKIICTLGPASLSRENILLLAQKGMNVARINFSHGSQEQHQDTIRRVKEVSDTEGICITTLLDTKGAEIRTGDVKEPIMIKKGQEIVFSPDALPDEKLVVIHVNYDEFADDVRETDRILLDNGEMVFDIVEIRKKTVLARAREDGRIGSRRHINLPGADIALPSITDKDWSDIEFGIRENMDCVALSFIRTADEVKEVRAFIEKHKSTMKIITKVETKQSVENIDAIIDASDGIMVARGDLGAEIPFELIPAIQDSIVEKCRANGKFVIVATHMLESMIQHPMPTRAEVTDVAHAAMTRADATMLSGETAMGKHPIEAINAMSRILVETESHLSSDLPRSIRIVSDEYEARAEAAVTMAYSLRSPAIIVLTRSGITARAVSRFRPLTPVYALTADKSVQYALQLYYGVTPLQLEFSDDPETNVAEALKVVKSVSDLKKGQRVVVVSDFKTPGGNVSTVHSRTIP